MMMVCVTETTLVRMCRIHSRRAAVGAQYEHRCRTHTRAAAIAAPNKTILLTVLEPASLMSEILRNGYQY